MNYSYLMGVKDVSELRNSGFIIEEIDGDCNFKNTYLFINVKKDNKTKIEYGDQIEFKGDYLAPNIQRNYKGFDYKEALKRQKVYGTVNANNIKVKNKQKVNPILILANKTFLRIKNNIEVTFPKDLANLTLAIMLGYTDNLDEEIQENFRDSNMAHILAVSGMHISYIISGLMIILKINSIGKRKSKIITIIILIAYMFITGFALSVVRATVMACLHLASGIFYRKNDIWTSISISLLLIIIYNPFLITSISVLLSYGGTIGIIVFSNIITNLLENKKLKNIIHFMFLI